MVIYFKVNMELIGKEILNNFIKKHADAESSLKAWMSEVDEANWETPHDVKKRFPKASIVKNKRAIFKICGNNYRLLTLIAYKTKVVMVEKIGTHKEYDKWDI